MKLVILIAAQLCMAARAPAPDPPQAPWPSTQPVYRVVRVDGSTTEVAAVPTSNQGVQTVERIVVVPSASWAGPTTTTPVERRADELAWNGKAWAKPRRDGGEGRDIAACLKVEVTRAEREAGRPEASPLTARRARSQAQALRQAAQDQAALTATGEVQAVAGLTGADEAQGIAKPLSRERVVGHRVQVWPMPAGAGLAAIQDRQFTYTVQMAHPVAGALGAFYYVAYADTDGDGAPDKLIARSGLAQADKPGGWTSWTFTTSEHMVFVGNAWCDAVTGVYFETRDKTDDAEWRGPLGEAWVGPFFLGLPDTQPAPACLTSLRVKIAP